MKILTWNINGIRAATEKQSIKALLDSLSADIICLQETKVTRDMLDEPTAIVDGYETYMSFSRKRTGYSGTANYCKFESRPVKADEGLTGRLSIERSAIVGVYGCTDHLSSSDLDALDAEGRCVITQHEARLPSSEIQQIAVINVYVPLAGEREDRLQYKMKFLGLLQSRAEALIESGVNVIIVGDLNLVHRQIDNCEEESVKDFKLKSSRIWMNNLLQPEERDAQIPKADLNISEFCPEGLKGGLFSDVFRRLHPDRKHAFTNWCTSTSARKSNYGRRLDYILIDNKLAKYVTSCEIMPDFEGSDHCPVIVNLDCDPVASESTPEMCAKFMPEFKGQQQKLSSFFSKGTNVYPVPCERSELPVSFTTKSKSDSSLSDLKTSPESEKSSLKRSFPELEKPKSSKFLKSNSLNKQTSIASFFLNKTKSVSVKKDEACNYLPQNNNNDNTIPNNLSESQQNNSHSNTNILKKQSTSKAWSSLLGGLPPPPLCPGHKEPCELKTVKKSGPNKNKQFYCCARPDGPTGNKDSRCNFFLWLHDRQKQKKNG